ncbi:glutathione-dependent disulfide-bond oxidoreductase [Pasteurella atlantica]|uniref:Glutathione-dependent disulfide-bond oxidoreductase n=2 Tax=Pasteurellaceae TaxID=712 RepID=A0ACC6HKM9_9PAST|nr:glutathione-dependent disulfide-bond oxidoreductase [Pasteurella atlantica]MDP8051430.1 glutathione-dependent disulfide-bond oxidoreductase [Pasteurella atlantica]MDP8104690.1 glutathione-dependent disulfide-bond oxidoreductase [Pasteurella atlantica]MDP8148088.1 glutathione-dependent disulfide-bond oxidoreductase [Pasteurella atlantica]
MTYSKQRKQQKEVNVMTTYTPPKVWKNKENSHHFNCPTAGARFEQILPRGDKPLQLYSLNTPNGIKINIMLKELALLNVAGAEFDAYQINIMEEQQFGSDFVTINPNSKIPALIDQSLDEPIKLFESGAILIYLAEKYGYILPKSGKDRAECLSWLMWQMGSAPYLGGGFGHFYHYAPEPIEYAIDRFTMETKRQLDLLNKHLADNEYICKCGYSIADMAIWAWYGQLALGKLYTGSDTFLDIKSYQHLMRWAKQISERDAVQKAMIMELQPI